MRKIQTRLILAFLFIIILLFVQGLVAYHNIRSLLKTQEQAYHHQLQIKDYAHRLATTRLLVFKILGTLNPAEMDAFHDQFEDEKARLKTALINEGIEKPVIDAYFDTYDEVIALHYDFRHRTAGQLINQASKRRHAELVQRLNAHSLVVQQASEKQIQQVYQKILYFTFGILAVALLVALLLAFILARNLTDRQQAEDELRASEAKYRSILDNASVVIFIKDLDGRYVFVNKMFEQLHGISNEAIQGLRDVDIFSRELADQFRKNDVRVLQSREPQHIEEQAPYADGIHDVLSTKFPLKDRDDISYALCGIATDITPLKQAQKAVAASEERLKLALDSVSDAVWDWRVDTGEVYFSSRWYTMLGYAPYELPQAFDTWQKLLHPDDLADSKETVFRHLEQARPFEIEFRMRTKDGQWRWILARGKTVETDDTGRAVRMLGTHMDITERKNAEREIIQQKERAERFLNVANVMFIGLNADGTVYLANQKACKVLEYDEADIVGRNWFDNFIPRARRDAVREVFGKLMAGELDQVEYFENSVVSKSGREKFIAWHNTYISDDHGHIIGILGSGDDITDKKRLEEQLQQTQKMEAIGNLAGGIAHDFNNILFPIIGLAELLIEDLPEGSVEQENAKEIIQAAKRAGDLVQQILTFSRQSAYQQMPVRVQQVLKEVYKLCRATIPADIEIVREVQADCGRVMADPTQLHQIAMNLITNAYHAMGDTGGTISVRLQEIWLDEIALADMEMKPGRYAMLSVADTGSGIPPAVLEKIFDPYFTTKAPGKGTGLGLSVVYGIVKSLNGNINVYSEVGQGTTFNVYLPVIEKYDATVSIEKTDTLATGTERILLIDDEEAVMRLEKTMLERLGYQVTAFASSVDALEAFRRRPSVFDLVVSDMTMPNMTGDRLARELIAIRPDIPVIICTGFSERMNRKKAAAMGIRGFLMKPLVKSDMARLVRNVLDAANTP